MVITALNPIYTWKSSNIYGSSDGCVEEFSVYMGKFCVHEEFWYIWGWDIWCVYGGFVYMYVDGGGIFLGFYMTERKTH